MSSNKTWLFSRDTNTADPYGVDIPTEFDVYEDALNVAQYVVSALPNASIYIYVMNYSRTSGVVYKSNNNVLFDEIGFPIS